MKNEKTSKRVAAIAGRILAIEAEHPRMKNVCVISHPLKSSGNAVWFSWDEIQAVAASCLTQTPSKHKTTKPKRGKK